VAETFRLAAGCQFRGADDSLPLVVANLVSMGVDLLMLVDHLNESIPLEQLQALTDGRCELRVIRKQTTNYAQPGVHSLLMRMAQESGAHAYLQVDADEFPDDTDGGPTFRQVIETWLSDDDTQALIIPHQNYLQRRDVDRWSFETFDAPVYRVLGPVSADARDEAGFLGRTPLVRAVARLAEPGGQPRWVRWGAHRLYGNRPGEPDVELSMEVSPNLVIRHLPNPSRSALEARVGFRSRTDGTVTDNRGTTAQTWDSVSMPVSADDAQPSPAVRTVHDDAFARIRARIEAAGVATILANDALANRRTVLAPTPADDIFAIAADLLTATIRPSTVVIGDAVMKEGDDVGVDDTDDTDAGDAGDVANDDEDASADSAASAASDKADVDGDDTADRATV